MIRRLEVLVIAAFLIVAAFSTGLAFLFYLVYLGVLVVGGSYVLTRLGLADLEAGYAVNQLHGHVGDQLRVTYTLRNASRLPKPPNRFGSRETPESRTTAEWRSPIRTTSGWSMRTGQIHGVSP